LETVRLDLKIAEEHFPTAIQIVDLYTRANIWLSWPAVYGTLDPKCKLGERPVTGLDASQVEKVMGAIWSLQSPDKKVQAAP